ncbi:MAG: DHH family phosphoesterase [Planctomycetota bacterium]|jgi:nanoRNase/pAp phosphatase (c-di-AMP/oligoRNAs hydrolase)|nr:DHH family phosphoesterase [Planctomycetota bacterium]
MNPEFFDRFAEALPSSGGLLLCTHRHPDPDGLGAVVGLSYLLEKKFGLQSELVLEGRIRRAENVAMRQLLEITALPKGGVDPADYNGVLVVDSQPGFSHTHPPGGLPILAVIDHHEGPRCEEGKEPPDYPFHWVNADYGATSTMVHVLMQHYDVEPDVRTATALFCGVRYDTNNLLRGATEFDERSFMELEGLADRRIIGAIDQPPLSRRYFQQMQEAMSACQDYGTLLLTLLGEVQSPESVAEVADWFLRLEGQQWSLAGGACDGRYQISLRCDMPDADAYPALRYIIGKDGSCGGHGRMAGGQISLADLSLEEIRERVCRRAVELFGLADVEPKFLVP